ncbi:MAG: ribonuclease P [Promethearchaeota archaeon]
MARIKVAKRRSPRAQIRQIARARIDLLWKQSSQIAQSDPDGAKRCMEIADRIAQKARIKVPVHIKRRLCKKCGRVLLPGRNCQIRIRHNRERHLSVTCLSCGAVRRFPVR